jgi:WD40 repeat protein
LIHVFDASARDFPLVETHDDHTSSITAIRFAQSEGAARLLSSSADKSAIFRQIQARPFRATRYHQDVGQHGTVFDLDLEPALDEAAPGQFRNVVMISQDKRVSVCSVSTGKAIRSHKLDTDAGEPVRLELDRAGVFAAVACADRSLRVIDSQHGDCVARGAGHSEHVTCVRWSNDSRRLFTGSAA